MANEVSRRNFLQCSSLAGAGLAVLAPLSASEKTYQKGKPVAHLFQHEFDPPGHAR